MTRIEDFRLIISSDGSVVRLDDVRPQKGKVRKRSYDKFTTPLSFFFFIFFRSVRVYKD